MSIYYRTLLIFLHLNQTKKHSYRISWGSRDSCPRTPHIVCFSIKQKEQIFRDEIYSELTLECVPLKSVGLGKPDAVQNRIYHLIFKTRLEIWVWGSRLWRCVDIAIDCAKPLV